REIVVAGVRRSGNFRAARGLPPGWRLSTTGADGRPLLNEAPPGRVSGTARWADPCFCPALGKTRRIRPDGPQLVVDAACAARRLAEPAGQVLSACPIELSAGSLEPADDCARVGIAVQSAPSHRELPDVQVAEPPDVHLPES